MTVKSVPAQPLTFKEAADKYPYGSFHFGLWVVSFLMLGFSMSPFEISQTPLAAIGVATFFLNSVYYLGREIGNKEDENLNNLCFGPVVYFLANAVLGQASWMNYSSRTLLLEFIVITVAGILFISKGRYAHQK